ncbi:MAG: succinate dehydrogenase, cytochrome b556 subunit [Hyphomonadaceae bacterium]|nr:MAG: succinate dehydrogenase cytochrome b556 subunit [Caulobacteraceae bacterium]MBT9446330.1 succinate dehydrogenase, cytochrome b556 subunit [Hyphomonadaceae bacterium]TPW07982.1 MAG: succinate dehydrogenase cytochrome b556 subunit [Alphaproteobacteria bacterium]
MAAPPDNRPLSPHLQVWRPHITMVASISNRFAGAGLVVGAFALVAWLWALAAGPEDFANVSALLKSTLGQIALFLVAVAGAYHFAAGVRHLVWDAGRGFSPRVADLTGWGAFIFALAAPVALWALAGA